MYTDYEIKQLPLTVWSNRRHVEKFLSDNGLTLDAVDYYVGVFTCTDEEEMVAGGGLEKNLIKCIAVSDKVRGEGISNRLVSHLISVAIAEGYTSVKLFTKLENQEIFKDLGFTLLAKAKKAILMENGVEALNTYLNYLSTYRKEGKSGVIVMNANPFTHGHHYLVAQAAKQVDHLYVIVVKEDLSDFPYSERLDMVRRGCEWFPNVMVLEGSDYVISKATFPTYFLKQEDDANDTYMELDLNLFTRYIAPALNATIRFVGTEPTDKLTVQYNERMKQQLPKFDIQVIEISRMKRGEEVISASTLRNALLQGSLRDAARIAFPTSIPYMISKMVLKALMTELDTTPKPGLVDREDNGAHHDMNYQIMRDTIFVLRPFFTRLALLGWQENLPQMEEIREIGIEGERAMLLQTGGVNTYKGALFAMGLTVVATSHLYYKEGTVTDGTRLSLCIAAIAAQFVQASDTHGGIVQGRFSAKGALANARDGYSLLFNTWLPYYDAHREDRYRLQKTLLHIMATLDDTNILYRVGEEKARMVCRKAKELLDNFSIEGLKTMNHDFIRENISPGGSADMLSLTIFIHSILN